MALPFVDEHRVTVAAPADAVWRALAAPGPGERVTVAYAALVGAVPRRASGDPLAEGSTVPGFEVTEAQPGRRLVLTGRHRFSAYTLTYLLEETAAGTVLHARTHAAFPGIAGALYRLAVIRSGAHKALMGALLKGIRHRAEAAATGQAQAQRDD